ncbi:T9SS type A sorting domain-containing protein [Flavobacteriaceae bacterium SZ-1-7]|uniref:hypothetical protein n=1 Tax=Tamlana sedimenti TaxID=3134126 RepID=UPI003120BC69
MMKTTLLKNFLTFCVGVFAVGALSAQTITWTGAVDSVFVNPANWDLGVIPSGTHDVVIDSTTIKPFYITSLTDAGNGDNYVNHLNGSGGTLTLAGPMLVYAGGGNYFGGNLTLNDGADLNIRNQGRFGLSGNPSVITINGGLLNTKNQLIIGESGDCTFTMWGGEVTSTTNGIILGGYAGNGKINLNGGTLTVAGGFAINEAGAGTGELFINGGTLMMSGNQETWANDYVAAGKITCRPGKLIGVAYDSGTDMTTVVSYDPGNTVTWTGAVDSDFTNPGNWDLGIVPDESDDVVMAESANPAELTVSLKSFDPQNNFLEGAVSHIYGVSGTPLVISAPLAVYAGGGNYFGGDLTLEAGADVNMRNQGRFGQTDNNSVVNINGGLLNTKNYLILSDNGNVEFNVNGGDVTSTAQGAIIGGYNGYAALNVNSGTITLNGLALDERADRSGAGHITIDGGSLILAGDQAGIIPGLIADGKLKVAPGKTISTAFDFTNTTITAVAGAAPKEVAYLTKGKTMAAGASAVDNDAIIRMLQADANFNVTVIVDPASDIDLSGYDLAIFQETFGSSDAIWTGSGGIQNIAIPTIINKTYAWAAGKAGITESDAAVTESTSLFVQVPHGPRRADPLFSGIDFSGGNDIKIFADLSTDDIGTAGGGAKGFQILNNIDIANPGIGGSTGSMHAEITADVVNPAAAIVFNELRAGVQLGENAADVLAAPVIAFSMNYGAIALGDGANISSEALTIWRNAAYHLTGMISPSTLYVNPDYLSVGDELSSSISTDVKAVGNRIYVSNVTSATQVNIYSITGALVKSIKTNEDTDFSFRSGLWIATIKTAEGSKSVKFITK